MTKRRRPAASRRLAEQRFWGSHQGAATDGARSPGSPGPSDSSVSSGATGSPATGTGPNGALRKILPTSDPGVLVRSLGPPPLALDPGLVERHLTAVYEEAVRAATALAAASGLLADDEESA
jgi:hypothetical protein